MGNDGQLESTSTCDTDLAVHPNMNDTNLPLPPPVASFSPISTSSTSPIQGHKRLLLSSPSSPTSGRRNEPVGLTVDIDRSGSPSKGNRSSLPLNSPGGAMIWAVEDGTPAAEALRANADVKVTKVGKAARFLHVQTVRNSAKKILHVGSGAKRGKPPRIPGTSSQDVSDAIHTEELEKDDATSRRENGNLDMLPEDPNEDEMHDYESVFDEEDGQPQILKSQSSDSSDAGVPTKIAIFESEPSSLVLLDAKGKKQEVLLDRKMKKKMKKPKKKKPKRNYVKGKVIDGQHELYALSIAMMLGLRYSIFLTNNQILKDRKNVRMWLDSDEFMKVEKYSFRPDGGNNTPPHQLSHTFKFKDYSPLPFAFIRRMFGINEYEFHHSVCGNANFIEFISNAKSGQFFFYSSDGKYMIKTMTNSESKFLRRILPHYFRHCAQNPNTILTKFLGMYRVKLYHLRKNVKFVIMNSVFDTDKILSSFYDLKGSVVGRDAKPGESVLKDNDLRRSLKQSGIILPEQVRKNMREQVRRDCSFLKDMKIMDYSMLVGIHYKQTKNSKTQDINGLAFRGGARKPSQLERTRSVPLSLTSNVFQHGATVDKPSRGKEDAFTVFIDSPKGVQEKKIVYTRSSSDAISLKSPDLDDRASFWPQQKPSPNNVVDLRHPLSATKSLPPPTTSVGEGESIISTTSFGYDDEDEGSILEGPRHPGHLKGAWKINKADDGLIEERERIDRRREQAIEQNYWPFHRHYELNGHRRIVPMKATTASIDNFEGDIDTTNVACTTSCFGDPADYDPDLKALRENLTLDEFFAPITGRKDGGHLMDISGLTLPLKVTTAAGKTQECDGKIYYIGIIDILQQFNVRKRLEARLRKMQGGEIGASCVHPEVYADRFVDFFDEYTKASNTQKDNLHEGASEEIVFEASTRPKLD